MTKNNPKVSVIIPVKNEAGILRECLDSLKKLDYPGESLEIIIADGLSTDGTKDIALSYKVKVVDNPRQIVSSGRNCGFKESSGDIVAFTDADCTFDVNWIKNSVKYFEDERVGGIGGLTFTPKESSDFEKAIDFIFGLAEDFGLTSHRKSKASIRQVSDIPGCNAIYRRLALEKAMPVDENLLTAEDAWMNYCVRRSGYKLLAVSDVMLWHHRRNNPRKFLRQMYRFAIGRLQAGKKNRNLLNIFHIFMGLSAPLIIFTCAVFLLLGAFAQLIKLILFIFSGVFLLALVKTRSFSVAVNVVAVTPMFVIAWSVGFLKELFFPLKDAAGK